jgi:hypothetical protein
MTRVKKAYQKKLKGLKRHHPNFFNALNIAQEYEFSRYWSRFGWKVSADWYRYYVNRSGLPLKNYVPNDVFYVRMERTLNDPNEAFFWANKNLLEKHYGKEYFPETLVRIISGDLYDSDYNEISLQLAEWILKRAASDVVMKVAEESCGGHGLKFYSWREGWFFDGEISLDLSELLRRRRPCLLQKVVRQAQFCRRFNPSSVNTFRIVTLRRPRNGEVVVLKRILRMGVGSTKVDNQSSGGISVGIFADGRINAKAFDGEGIAFESHPTTGIRFAAQHFDCVSKLDAFAISLARGVPSLRLLSLDIVMCEDGVFKCLEVNTYGVQIDFLQTYDGGMLDPYTDEVVSYCLDNCNRYVYRHIRGFYF